MLITVHPEFDVLLDAGEGRTWKVFANANAFIGTPIPVSLYRRNRWMGVLKRRLVRMRGYGREYLADVWYRRAVKQGLAKAIPGAGVAVDPPETVRRGCGCGGKKAAPAISSTAK